MEDLAIAIADTIGELEAMEDDLNAEIAAYEQYCNNNPGACSVEEASGPSELYFANCWSKAAQATVATAGAIANVILVEGSVSSGIASGLRLSVVGAAAAYTSIFAASFFAGYYIAAAVDCFYSQSPIPEAWALVAKVAGVGCPTVATVP
jgi:hypothetical protein